MTITMTHRGGASIRARLHALASVGRDVVREVSREVDRRHAEVMRRKRIPRDTGRLEDSLTQVGHPDREVRVGRDQISIATTVPYARYQEARISRLHREEQTYIFHDPIAGKYRLALEEGV